MVDDSEARGTRAAAGDPYALGSILFESLVSTLAAEDRAIHRDRSRRTWKTRI
jgi:hypothetical protein